MLRSEKGRPTTRYMSNINVPSNRLEHPAVFDAWFSRWRCSLYFMACRVLGGPNGAEDAVQNCFLTASRNPPSVAYEGAFGSWLLRILIDEALLILRQKNRTSEITREPLLTEVR